MFVGRSGVSEQGLQSGPDLRVPIPNTQVFEAVAPHNPLASVKPIPLVVEGQDQGAVGGQDRTAARSARDRFEEPAVVLHTRPSVRACVRAWMRSWRTDIVEMLIT